MEKLTIQEILYHDDTYRYKLLGRMKQDCANYLSFKARAKRCLWAQDEKEQIEIMKAIYNSFTDDKKPVWLTMAEIEHFSTEMVKMIGEY